MINSSLAGRQEKRLWTQISVALVLQFGELHHPAFLSDQEAGQQIGKRKIQATQRIGAGVGGEAFSLKAAEIGGHDSRGAFRSEGDKPRSVHDENHDRLAARAFVMISNIA